MHLSSCRSILHLIGRAPFPPEKRGKAGKPWDHLIAGDDLPFDLNGIRSRDEGLRHPLRLPGDLQEVCAIPIANSGAAGQKDGA